MGISLSHLTKKKFGVLKSYLFLVFSCFSFDVLLQLSRHIGRQIVEIVIWLRNPAKDTIELEDDAWTTAFITKVLFLGALSAQQFDVKVANLSLSRPLVEAAAGEVLAAAGHSVVRYFVPIEILN